MFLILERAINRISEWSGRVAMLVVIPLVLALSYEVLSRHFLGAPTSWAYELSYFLTGTILLLGVSYALRHKQHVNVDVLQVLFPRCVGEIVNLLGYIALLAICVPFTIHVANYAMHAFVTGETSGNSAWNPLIWPFRAVWAVGLALFCLQLVAEIIRCIVNLCQSEEQDPHQ